MHARELVELGAILAAHGDIFVRQITTSFQPHVEEYWVASRSRQIRWGESIKAYQRSAGDQQPGKDWFAVRPTIEEILTSELLARIWAALACSRDQQTGTKELGPIARSILVGHLEARNRALNVMIYGKGFTVEEGVVLNRLRRHVERWTDMLLGFLMQQHDVVEFAFQAERCRNFAADLRFEEGYVSTSQSGQMVLASLRAAFQSGVSIISPNADLNARIASSILACFQHDTFDSLGLFKSFWMLRLNQVTEETEGLINDLIRADDMTNRRVSLRR